MWIGQAFIFAISPAAIAVAIVAGGAVAFAGVASAEDRSLAHSPAVSGEGQRYVECVRLARKNPGKAFDEALSWSREMEGDFAPRHCLATALFAARNFSAAAELFEELYVELAGEGLNGSNTVTIGLLRQAGQAWMLGEEYERAADKFTALLAMLPGDVDAIIDRGIVLAESGHYWEALDDLNRAIDLAPERIDAYILRANAYRMVGAPELVLDDLERVLEKKPRNAGALFGRGMIRKKLGDIEGARSDLQSVLLLAPRTPLARSARTNLRNLATR